MSKGNVLIIGGSGGIGKGINQILIEDGFKTILSYNTQRPVDSDNKWIHVNLLDLDENVILSLVGIKYLIFAAGVSNPNYLMEENQDIIQNVMDITCNAPLKIIRLLLNKNKLRKIIFVSSKAGINLSDKTGLYSYSKACLNVMIRIMANELSPRRITVNGIAPGWCNTRMAKEVLELRNLSIDIECRKKNDNKILEPIEIGNICKFLLNESANHITGQLFEIDSPNIQEGDL